MGWAGGGRGRYDEIRISLYGGGGGGEFVAPGRTVAAPPAGPPARPPAGPRLRRPTHLSAWLSARAGGQPSPALRCAALPARSTRDSARAAQVRHKEEWDELKEPDGFVLSGEMPAQAAAPEAAAPEGAAPAADAADEDPLEARGWPTRPAARAHVAAPPHRRHFPEQLASWGAGGDREAPPQLRRPCLCWLRRRQQPPRRWDACRFRGHARSGTPAELRRRVCGGGALRRWTRPKLPLPLASASAPRMPTARETKALSSARRKGMMSMMALLFCEGVSGGSSSSSSSGRTTEAEKAGLYNNSWLLLLVGVLVAGVIGYHNATTTPSPRPPTPLMKQRHNNRRRSTSRRRVGVQK